jgi:hypothetical protein
MPPILIDRFAASDKRETINRQRIAGPNLHSTLADGVQILVSHRAFISTLHKTSFRFPSPTPSSSRTCGRIVARARWRHVLCE